VNSWLPLAHPVAPTNVSALLSAVIVNLGIYGIMRFNLDLRPVTGSEPGLIVLIVGSISALVGILYATIQAPSRAQHDREHGHRCRRNRRRNDIPGERACCHRRHRPDRGPISPRQSLGLQEIPFVGTGAVEAGTGTRDLDRLGGIVRKMPWTSAFFLVGVLSISAFAPLNGFVSE
jgi:hydrogenase-4 component B